MKTGTGATGVVVWDGPISRPPPGTSPLDVLNARRRRNYTAAALSTRQRWSVQDELSTRAGEVDPYVNNAAYMCSRRRLHLRAQSVATWTTSFTSSVRESLRASTLTFRRTGAAAPERGTLVM